MHRWTKALCLINTLILAGCSGDFQSSEVQLNERALADKAVVVTRIHAPHQNMVLGETDSEVSSVWVNSSNPDIKYNFYVPGAFSYFYPSDLQEHMVAPGTYVLRSMQYKINGVQHDISFSKDTRISFTAQPGEVVYVGDIQIINPKGDGTSLTIADRYEEAHKQLPKDLPGLQKNLEKRLITGIR